MIVVVGISYSESFSAKGMRIPLLYREPSYFTRYNILEGSNTEALYDKRNYRFTRQNNQEGKQSSHKIYVNYN